MAERAVILDGYVDEPALLGVPPYISTEPRLLAGVLEELEIPWEYITIDDYRKKGLPDSEILIVHGGVTVPGKYLGGMPLSRRECWEIGVKAHDRVTYLGGPLAEGNIESYDHSSLKDLSAYIHHSLVADPIDRWITADERERWLLKGAKVVTEHPLYPEPLMAEISTYRGCVRYFTGGCSFCSEPGYGKPEFREQRDIIAEMEKLYSLGIRNFRLGGQSCMISYKAQGVGSSEKPVPMPGELNKLFSGIRDRCPGIKVLHVDNANPAVMSAYPDETAEILDILVKYTTSGNVLALGMESADPVVIRDNNLNSSPEDVEDAIRMINKAGRDIGENGMPKMLPGINLLAGLKGERPETFKLNFDFLQRILDDGLLLRRINIRQIMSDRSDFVNRYPKEFRTFKATVREEIDRPMLVKMLPVGSILKDVYMEEHRGKLTFGRQIGTYPLLVGVEYQLELGSYHDISITGHGYRSITGVHHPFFIDRASYSELKALPGIGEKRAAKIFRSRPRSADDLRKLVDEDIVDVVLRYAGFSV